MKKCIKKNAKSIRESERERRGEEYDLLGYLQSNDNRKCHVSVKCSRIGRSYLSTVSLILVLVNELDKRIEDNPFGIPARFNREVYIAQTMLETFIVPALSRCYDKSFLPLPVNNWNVTRTWYIF